MNRNVNKGQEKVGIRCVNDRRDDIGTWHRAYAVAEHLLNAGVWDGEGTIWVADPHATLAAIDLYGKRAGDLVRGMDWDYYARPTTTAVPSARAEVVEAALTEDERQQMAWEAEADVAWWETVIALDSALTWRDRRSLRIHQAVAAGARPKIWVGDWPKWLPDWMRRDDSWYLSRSLHRAEIRATVLARQAQRKARIAQAVAAGARPYVARWGLGPNAVVWDGKVYRVVDLAGGAE